MSGAGFILAINLSVAGLFAASFMAVAAFDRGRAAARWLGCAYLVGMSNMLFEFGIARFGSSLAAVVASFAALLAAMIVFNVGVARNYGVRAPWLTMVVIFAASVAACALIQDMPRDSFTRMLVYQSPYFIMQGIAVAVVAQAKQLTRLDKALMVLLAASALQFLSKPFLFRTFGGTGATPSDYLATRYAMFSQSMGTVFAIAIALLMLVIVMRNALTEATERSETDPLSGLLNRGGFESRARSALGEAARQGGWVSLVLADLDHFKSINDSYGHAAGDKLITTFAAFLRSSTSGHHVAGRIGGEEFAVLLPGTRLAAARLFAEAARAGCSTLTVEGIPDTRRLTASFGVAELVAGEDIVDLLHRADVALYLAKRSGRDCVRIAPPQDAGKASGPGKVIRLG